MAALQNFKLQFIRSNRALEILFEYLFTLLMKYKNDLKIQKSFVKGGVVIYESNTDGLKMIKLIIHATLLSQWSFITVVSM